MWIVDINDDKAPALPAHPDLPQRSLPTDARCASCHAPVCFPFSSDV